MVLFCLVGELGAGKTLGLTFLTWNNWFKKGRRIFSNYNLYGIPFTKVKSIPDLDSMSSGFFSGDELWTWLNSWEGKSEKNQLISSILLKSRKRDITIAYSTQTLQQVTKRIRDVTDFTAYPILSPDGTWCRMNIFRGTRLLPAMLMPPARYFNVESVIAMYNTYEEIKPIELNGVSKEMYMPIRENPAYITYCKQELKIKSEKEIIKRANMIEKLVNPYGFTSEKQRKDAGIVENYDTSE